MAVEFSQIQWDEQLEDDCRQIIRLAVREDLGRQHDWTTLALVDSESTDRARMVTREPGVVAGLPVMAIITHEMDLDAAWTPHVEDGDLVEAGTTLGQLSGRSRDLLTAERLMLNFVGRLSGIATLASRYVAAVSDASASSARVYDTRKTTPGWRRLEKYAVRCGGGCNHRTGLYDAVLIKDNHLAVFGRSSDRSAKSAAEAVRAARDFAAEMQPAAAATDPMIVEIEVDTFEQLESVLAVDPDIVLLDNMSPAELRQAVELRNRTNPNVQLEASGGVRLSTIADVAGSGVDRISVGALTHSAIWLDIGLDWG